MFKKMICSICFVVLTLGMCVSTTHASLWINADGDDDWWNPNNWGGPAWTGGPGVLPDDDFTVGAIIAGAAVLNFNQVVDLPSEFLVVSGPSLNIMGGSLTYFGDGLYGIFSGAADVNAPAEVNQTGGILTQTGGGAGFLIGHNRGCDYYISGGMIHCWETCPSLCVDFDFPAFGVTSKPSSLTISGNSVVDVESPSLHFGANATLNVLENGMLIWRDHTILDLLGEVTISPAVDSTGPVIDPNAVINAQILQLGPDVVFIAPPEPCPDIPVEPNEPVPGR